MKLLTRTIVRFALLGFCTIPALAQVNTDQGFESYNQAVQNQSDQNSANANEFGNVLMGNSTYVNPDTGEQVVLPYYYNSPDQVDGNGNTYTQNPGGNWAQTHQNSGLGTELAPAPVEVAPIVAPPVEVAPAAD